MFTRIYFFSSDTKARTKTRNPRAPQARCRVSSARFRDVAASDVAAESLRWCSADALAGSAGTKMSR